LRLPPATAGEAARLGPATAPRAKEVDVVEAQVGATIVVESERTAQPGRRGVIEEVLQEHPPRYRVRWDDGKETTFAPAAGVALIEWPAKT
jgi:Domain of unknown function (DUF1918)